MKVYAYVSPDSDPARRVRFDCTEWLSTLDVATIDDLRRREWGHCESADRAAMESTDKRVLDLFSDLEVLDRYGHDGGFEVEIDADDAGDWLRANRPEVAKAAGLGEED